MTFLHFKVKSKQKNLPLCLILMYLLSPVQAQSTQVEHSDADGGFLQERNQFAQEQTEHAVSEGPLHRH